MCCRGFPGKQALSGRRMWSRGVYSHRYLGGEGWGGAGQRQAGGGVGLQCSLSKASAPCLGAEMVLRRCLSWRSEGTCHWLGCPGKGAWPWALAKGSSWGSSQGGRQQEQGGSSLALKGKGGGSLASVAYWLPGGDRAVLGGSLHLSPGCFHKESGQLPRPTLLTQL